MGSDMWEKGRIQRKGVIGRLGRKHGGGLLKKEGSHDQINPGRITVNIEVTTVFTHS